MTGGLGRATLPVLIAATLLGALGPSAVAEARQEVIRSIRFDKGAKSGVVEAAVVRGEQHIYEFRARRGQRSHVVISSLESNAVFQLMSPANPVANGPKTTIAGPEARAWSGPLPRTGSYRIIVSGTRGNASYRLGLAIM